LTDNIKPSLTPPQSKPSDECVTTGETADSQKKWAPFIMTIRLLKGKPATFKATGANTWCATASSVEWVTMIQDANFQTKGMRGLHGVDAPGGGKQLMLVSPRFLLALGYFPSYADGGEHRNGGCMLPRLCLQLVCWYHRAGLHETPDDLDHARK
jgi:hypothetical protein